MIYVATPPGGRPISTYSLNSCHEQLSPPAMAVKKTKNSISAKSGRIRQMCTGMELFICSPVAPQLRIGVCKYEWGWGFKADSAFTLGTALAARAGYIQ